MGGTEAQLEVAPLKAVAAHTEVNLDDSLCSSPGGRDNSGVYLHTTGSATINSSGKLSTWVAIQ